MQKADWELHPRTINLAAQVDALRKASKLQEESLNSRDEEIYRLKAKNRELRERLEVGKNGTYCAYCGDSFPADDEGATQVSAHIKTCEKHPMREVEAKLASFKAVGRIGSIMVYAQNPPGELCTCVVEPSVHWRSEECV